MAVEAANLSDDAVLLAEISPAMRKKLEEDGLQRGIMTANTLIMAALAVTMALQHSDSTYATEISFGSLAIAVLALAILPFYLRKRSVAAELRYRRQHGKWRWDR